MPHRTTESARAAGRKRFEGMTPEQRRAATADARGARVQVKDVAEQLETFSVDILSEIRALRAEVAGLRQQRTQDSVAA